MRVMRCMEGPGQPLHSSCCLCTWSVSGNQQQPWAPHHMLSCRLQVVNFKGVTGWFYRGQSSPVLSENPHLCGPMLTAKGTQLLLFPCELWFLPPPPSEHQNNTHRKMFTFPFTIDTNKSSVKSCFLIVLIEALLA